MLVPEAYLTRRATINDTAERAITADQLNDLADFACKVLAEVEIVETSALSTLFGPELNDSVAERSNHSNLCRPEFR